MPGNGLPLAVVDGSMRFLGDTIQGWTVDQISDRAITLRAPSSDTHVVQMSVLSAEIHVPPEAMVVEIPETGMVTEGTTAEPKVSPLGVLAPDMPESESDAGGSPPSESNDTTSDEHDAGR